jgi:tetraacyldisaccharide 4'-kinase
LKIKGIYLLYRFLEAFGLPLVLIGLLWRAVRRRGYCRSLLQRFGYLPASFRQTVPGAIWLHAVSVGEAIAAVELVRQLRHRLPRSPIFVSVSTLAGYQTASVRFADMAGVFYAPMDYVFAVRRVLRALRPALLIVMETEIWPNLFREAKRTGAGLLLINGRISDRALERYQPLAWFFGPVVAQADLLLTQSEAMRARFLAIGAPPDKVRPGGNVKFDVPTEAAPPGSPVRDFIERLQPQAVWIAASTMPPAVPADLDEDEAVIEAFQSVSDRQPGLLLVLAPRKPERFEAAAGALVRAGIPFVRRSALDSAGTVELPGVLLLDSIGELGGLFPLADVVFLGGTLASRGGHNILEPARAGKSIIVGPHMENFADIAADFRAAGALIEVRDNRELTAAVADLLTNPVRAAALGKKALWCASSRQGATAGAVMEATRIFTEQVPCYRPAQPAFALLWLLSRLWIWGSARSHRRKLARRRGLVAPIISIGNITAGGTGKTPVVLHLSRKLKDAGWKPGILTRGYGRHSPQAHMVMAAGAQLAAALSGDEPQIFLRAQVAPVGISVDRWRVGHLLECEFGANVLLLDDGFQHVSLDRRVDIVIVDALNPFGGGYPLPLGRLREPLASLSRAHIFLITRADCGRLRESAECVLRRYNSGAPIFHSRALPEAWVKVPCGKTLAWNALPHARVAAFCALGNPQSFWCTLEALGLEVACRISYEDHHGYKPAEIRFMRYQFREAGAQLIVTTEKDIVNLCEDADRLLEPLPLYWLRIGVEIDREPEFLEAVLSRLE